jgi:hypothetical protein
MKFILLMLCMVTLSCSNYVHELETGEIGKCYTSTSDPLTPYTILIVSKDKIKYEVTFNYLNNVFDITAHRYLISIHYKESICPKTLHLGHKFNRYKDTGFLEIMSQYIPEIDNDYVIERLP